MYENYFCKNPLLGIFTQNFKSFSVQKLFTLSLQYFLRALLNQLQETFGFMVFSPFLIIKPKPELPKSGDYAILGLF
jgi:hypothetical protein